MSIEELTDRLYRNKDVLFDIILICVIGSLAISWFRGDFLIKQGGFSLPLDRAEYFYATLSVWEDRALGYSAPRQLAALMPYSLYSVFTSMIGLSLVSYEKLLFYLLFTFSGLSMYYLCYVVGMKETGRLFSSLFYMMNPYSLSMIWQVSHGMFLFPYAFAPFIIGMYIYIIKYNKGIRHILLLSIIWFFTTTTSYLNPVSIVLHWIPLGLYMVFFLIINKEYVIRKKGHHIAKVVAKQTFFLIIIWVALNSFWLILFLGSFQEEYNSATDSSMGIISDIETLKLDSANFIDIFRLTGHWGITETWRGDPFFSWGGTYFTTPFILISFLIPFFAFLHLLQQKNKRNSEYLFFVILAIIGAFLANGAYPPFYIINMFVYENLPYLAAAFRNIWGKWGMLLPLALSPMIGFGIDSFYDFLSAKLGKISLLSIFIIFILLFGIIAFPFWTGDVIKPEGEHTPSGRIKIPNYYFQIKKWSEQYDEDFRIFSLPMTKSYTAIYNWGDDNASGYSGSDIMKWFSTKSIINVNTGPIYSSIGETIENEPHKYNMAKLFGLLNSKYILLHKDTNWELTTGHSWWFQSDEDELTQFLNSQKDISLYKSFGKLYLYRIDDRYFLPHIYPATSSTLINGGIDGMFKIISEDNFQLENSILFLSDQIRSEQRNSISLRNIVFYGNSSYEPNYNNTSMAIQSETRVIYYIHQDNYILARSYTDWKSVVRTDGNEAETTLSFASLEECPYEFPSFSSTGWNTLNSTLVYIMTGSGPLVIDKITTDGKPTGISGVWWETGWMGMNTKPVTHPIIIPPNQRAIIDIGHLVCNLTIDTDAGEMPIPVYDGKDKPVSWSFLTSKQLASSIFVHRSGGYSIAIKPIKDAGILNVKIDDEDFILQYSNESKGSLGYMYIGPIYLDTGEHNISVVNLDISLRVNEDRGVIDETTISAKSYINWKKVITTDTNEDPRVFIFSSIQDCPYEFPSFSLEGWNTYNSTLIYLTTSSAPLVINEVYGDGKPTSIGGVWWETGWMGMSTKPIIYPIIIPPNQRAIIQIGALLDEVTLITAPTQIESLVVYSLKEGEDCAKQNMDTLFSCSGTSKVDIIAQSSTNYSIFTYIKSTPKRHTMPINLTAEAPRLVNRMVSSNPSFYPHGCTYTPSISDDDTLEITTFFDGPSEEEEYLEVRELIRELPLNRYPNVSISYKVEDPDIQIMKIGFKVKNQSGAITTIWRTLEPYEEWHTYEINLYDRILRTYPDKNYTLSEITIVPSKMWGVDCNGDKKGAYNYYLKDLEVSKSETVTEQPIIEFQVGDMTFKKEVNSSSFEWIKIGEIDLTEGVHTISWNSTGDVEIDDIQAIPKDQVPDKEVPIENIVTNFKWIQEGKTYVSGGEYTTIQNPAEDAETFNLQVPDKTPSITFQKINPSKYKVHVNSDEPFFLVFSESYDPQWKAYLDDDPFNFNRIIADYGGVKEAEHEQIFTLGDFSYLYADPISDDKHFIVNGYANAWYIEKTGNYDLTLYFLPQSLFYLGLFISGGTLFGCIGYIVIGRRKKRG